MTYTERLDAHLELLETLLCDFRDVLSERYDNVEIKVSVAASGVVDPVGMLGTPSSSHHVLRRFR